MLSHTLNKFPQSKFIGKSALVEALRESTSLKRKDVEAVINGFEKMIVDVSFSF
jgi:hypothetical protein